MIVLIPQKSRAEYFFETGTLFDAESCTNECAGLIDYPSAFR